MSTSYYTQNYNRSYNRPNYQNRPSQRKSFVEDRDAAFFLGKLNKHHDREHIYNQLKKLTKILNFYIAKFDMPNGANGRGNQGFAFVHTKSKEQARRIISMKHLRLGNQECEVKCYDGRTDIDDIEGISGISGNGREMGRETPDSGVRCVTNRNKPAFVNNPLKNEFCGWSSDSRSRVNSGIISESSRFSETGKISESEEIIQKINSESINHEKIQCSEETQDLKTNNYEQNLAVSAVSHSPVNSSQINVISAASAESDLHDQWLEEKTAYILNTVNDSSMASFMVKCDEYMRMLVRLDDRQIAEVQNIQNGSFQIQV